jgi:hypothetical protein
VTRRPTTWTTGPLPASAWHTTPRAAHQPSPSGLGLAVILLFWFSPLSLAVWLVGQLAILVQKRWHWHRFALTALAYLAYVLAVIGPEPALRRHFYVHQHFWQYVALLLGFGPPGASLSIGQVAHDMVMTQLWLGVPVGLLAAALAVYFAEHATGGAEWSPLVRRRQLVDQRARDRKTAKLLARPRDHKLSAPALGIALDGDLPSWVKGRYVVPPIHLRGKAMALVGAPGAGKTVTLTRLAYLAGRMSRKVCFVDCKGTDPTLVPALINAYRLGNPHARVGCWPATAMDMWRGTPSQIQSRLLSVEVFTEPFYQRVASAGLRLALTAPDMPPVDGSDELLRRLDADELASLWEGRPLELQDVEVIRDHLAGARLRYADFFAALAGAFDRGVWSYENVDLAVLTVPTLLSKAEADAAMRVVLEDYGHYATGRKPRETEDALLILDEFSALASGVDSAINLAERVRDVGVQVVVAAQSVEGLGNQHQAPRLLASCAGGVVVHQCPDPERLLALAGTVRDIEHNWEVDRWGPRGVAKARMRDRSRVDPELVRAAQPGEAWVIQAGHAVHLRVLPPPAVAPEVVEPAAAVPLGRHETAPLTVIPAPDSGRIAAAAAWMTRVVRRAGMRALKRRQRRGRLPQPGRRLGWRPAADRGRRR